MRWMADSQSVSQSAGLTTENTARSRYILQRLRILEIDVTVGGSVNSGKVGILDGKSLEINPVIVVGYLGLWERCGHVGDV